MMPRQLFAEGGGGRSLITSHHLEVSSDYDAFGIRESGVLFHVVEFPKHGELDVTVWERDSDNIFTLLDLNTDKGRHSLDAMFMRLFEMKNAKKYSPLRRVSSSTLFI